jgi:uncharacterized membrane protein
VIEPNNRRENAVRILSSTASPADYSAAKRRSFFRETVAFLAKQEGAMKTIALMGLVVLLILSENTLAQQSGQRQEGSSMQGMQGMMGEQKGGEGGMQGMGGMMGMMKMMDQCHAMMSAHKTGDADGALDILKKRYAKGEISKDDFERMKKDVE